MLRILAMSIVLSAHAGTGALDPNFSADGRHFTNVPASSSAPQGAMSVAIQPDGKLLVAGAGRNAQGRVVGLARFNADGTPDSSFGTFGRVVGAPAADRSTAYAIALQADGRIVVAGEAFVVARYNADGTADTTFNGTGTAMRVFTSGTAYAIAIQPDGRIVVAGQTDAGYAGIVRYNTNGGLDTSFGSNGTSAPSIPGVRVARSIALQPDGKLLLAGFDDTGFGSNFGVARLDADGTLDTTWNGTGYTSTDFAGGNDEAWGLALQPDGKVVVAGSAIVAGNADFALARYTSTGVLDATFNGSGKVTTAFFTGSPEGARSIALQPDGRIVLAGYFNSGINFIALARYTASGALDLTFNGTGFKTDSLGPPSEANAVAVQADGRIVTAGWRGPGTDFALTRHSSNGSLDPSFNGAGAAFADMGFAQDIGRAVAIQPDGKVIVAGATSVGPDTHKSLAVARHLGDGSRDTAFGDRGVAVYTSATCPISGCGPAANAVALQADGKIVVGGSLLSHGGNSSLFIPYAASAFLVARFNANGSLDSTFSGDGIATASPDTYSDARALAIQADGKIVLAGQSYSQGAQPPPPFFTSASFTLARLLPDGSLDTSFNGTGTVVTPLTTTTGAVAHAVAVQPDGRIVAVGVTDRAGTNKDFALVRYTAAGAVDATDIRDIDGNADDIAYAVAIQPDGKILVGGTSGARTALVRFTAPGVLDATFATGGKFLAAGAPLKALALRPDGRIVAVTEDWVVLRFMPDGVPDATFGTAGRLAASMGSGAVANALAVQPDGRIVVAGRGTEAAFDSADFAVARFDPAPALKLAPSSDTVDFGGQSMNTTSIALPVTITNASGAALTVTSVAASSGFTTTSDCGALAAGATCIASTKMTPSTEGAVGGLLTVRTASGHALSLPLAGVGERSLVTHYYRSILRRAPDAGGKTFWDSQAARVAALGASVNETWFAMAQQFYFSGEYAAFNSSNTAYATDLYNTFYNRAPDSGGLNHWVGQLDQGLPREVLLASFMFSAEFANFTNAIFGIPTARAEVNTVVDFYRGLLARTPDDGGFNFWVGRFRTAQCQGPGAVTNEVEAISSAFAVSGEYAARGRSNAQYVGDLYNAFLRRGGDLGGVQYWINQIAGGFRSREQVRIEFKNSPEFQGRVNAIIQQGCL